MELTPCLFKATSIYINTCDLVWGHNISHNIVFEIVILGLRFTVVKMTQGIIIENITGRGRE